MEYYGNTLCISATELVGTGIMSKSCYDSAVNRKRLNVVRRGGGAKGNTALVEVDSLPVKYRLKLEAVIPSGNMPRIKKWLKENFCIDSKASEFFFDKDLTVEAKARCIANASMLRCCIKLYYHGIYWQPLMGDKFDWVSLADAVKELRADYDHKLPASPLRLREKMNLFERNGCACLVSGKYGNQNAKKL